MGDDGSTRSGTSPAERGDNQTKISAGKEDERVESPGQCPQVLDEARLGQCFPAGTQTPTDVHSECDVSPEPSASFEDPDIGDQTKIEPNEFQDHESSAVQESEASSVDRKYLKRKASKDLDRRET